WVFLDAQGRRVSDSETIARCKSLAIPPAWTDVWICPWSHGHLQAVGTDAAGRRQYLYHPRWRERRERSKFDHVLAVAGRLPEARARAERDIAAGDMSRRHMLAVAFRLLDRGLFRVGGEGYAADH